MKLKQLFLAAALCIASKSFAYPAATSLSFDCTQKDDQAIVSIEGLDTSKNFKIVFQGKNTGIKKDIFSNNQRKLTYTAAKNLINPLKNDELSISIIDYYPRGLHHFHTCYYSQKNPAAMPRPAIQAARPELEQADSAPSQNAQRMDIQKIQNYADQQARTVANRVIDTYGRQEQYNSQFVKGFHTGYTANRIFQLSNSSYKAGFSDGKAEGKKRAQSKAADLARAKADKDALDDAKARHIHAIYQNGYVDDTLLVPSPTFDTNHFSQGFDFQSRFRDKLNALGGDFTIDFKGLRFGDEFFSVNYSLRPRFNLFDIISYNGKYGLLDSYFKDDHALREWLNSGLGGRYDHNLYHKMQSLDKIAFNSAFKVAYNRVISDKLEKKIQESYPEAFAKGTLWGHRAAKEESRLKGYEEGFYESLKKFGESYFKDYYIKHYKEGFQRWLIHFETRSKIDIALRVIPSKSSLGFDIVGKIMNYGGVSYHKPRFTAYSEVLSQNELIVLDTIADHSEIEVLLENFLSLKDDIRPSHSYELHLEIGREKFTINFTFDFQEMLDQFVSMEDGAQKILMRDSIVGSIIDEWHNNNGTFQEDIYKSSMEKNMNRSRLGVLVEYARLKGSKDLLKLHDLIANEDRSGSWIHWNKNGSFKNLLSQLKK